MTHEQLEAQIAAVSTELNACNQRAEFLRDKLKGLIEQYTATGEAKPLFIFRGKTKTLLAALQSEIQKAQ